MIITSQKGRGTKIHLLIDGEYKITTDAEFWSLNSVADGTDITDEEWEELVSAINYKKAFNKCADYLSRRNHSERELLDKVLKSGVDRNSTLKAIERFKELGYINDRDFAFEYTEYLINSKRYSVNRVKQELFHKGIAKDIISEAIDGIEADQAQTVVDIINKSYIRKLTEDGGKEKVIAALMRRGFSYSDIKEAFNRLENDE